MFNYVKRKLCNVFLLYSVEDGKLKASAIIPGLRVQYTTDNGHTWRDVIHETPVSESVKIGTRLVLQWLNEISAHLYLMKTVSFPESSGISISGRSPGESLG